MKEHKDIISDEQRKKLEDALAKVKDALKTENFDAMKTAEEQLTRCGTRSRRHLREGAREDRRRAARWPGPSRSGCGASEIYGGKEATSWTPISRWWTTTRRSELVGSVSPVRLLTDRQARRLSNEQTNRSAETMSVKPLAIGAGAAVEEQEVKKAGSLFGHRKESQEARLSPGHGKRDEDGKLIPFEVKKGDRVLISKYGGTEIKIDAKSIDHGREPDPRDSGIANDNLRSELTWQQNNCCLMKTRARHCCASRETEPGRQGHARTEGPQCGLERNLARRPSPRTA